ncbi:TPA: hypothetical protein RRH11_004422 [Klebsiella pneumoniae]|uniref:hypothetical protein n=1 Tax=Klebsiella pneumoniae TaxID=573 RepID=UPI0028CEC757|nr:hypothetical protein [Klebsiella pneumoniae]
MSTQYGFFIDSARCTGCKTCELACKDYKNLTPEVSFRRIYEYASGDWQEDNGVWQQNVFAYTRPSIVIKPNANARPCGDTTGYLANPKEV